MADPLSLIASIITIIRAAKTINKIFVKIKLFYKAPAGLLAFYNKVTNLTIVLRNVKERLLLNNFKINTPSQNILQHILSLIN